MAPANRSFLISAGWLSHHNKLRRGVPSDLLLLFFWEANIGVRPSTGARGGAHGPVYVYGPGVYDTSFVGAP